jgi:hypothetical protein
MMLVCQIRRDVKMAKNKSSMTEVENSENEESADNCRYCGTDVDDASGQFCSDSCKISYAEKHIRAKAK